MVDKSKKKGDTHKLRTRNYLQAQNYIIVEQAKKIPGHRIDYMVRDKHFKFTWVICSALARHATDSLRKQIAYSVGIKAFDPNAKILAVFDFIPGSGDGLALVRQLEGLGVKVVALPEPTTS